MLLFFACFERGTPRKNPEHHMLGAIPIISIPPTPKEAEYTTGRMDIFVTILNRATTCSGRKQPAGHNHLTVLIGQSSRTTHRPAGPR